MAVIVTGMDMPESCKRCPIRYDCYRWIRFLQTQTTTACHPKMEGCPLKSVDGLIEQIRRQEFVHFTDNGGYYMTPAEIKDVVETIIKKYCGLEESNADSD